MTRNQIEFWRLNETVRANKAVEAHNRAVLEYNYQVLEENKRANLAREAELHRSNVANEVHNERVRVDNFYFNSRQMAEQKRRNQESELMARRQLAELSKHNRASETAQFSQLKLQAMSLSNAARNTIEAERSNRANEQLNSLRIAETTRSNMRNEQTNLMHLNEQIRSNQASEAIRRQSNANTLRSLEEQMRHNRSVEAETSRHNLMDEKLQVLSMSLKTLGDTLKAQGLARSTGKYKIR